MLSDEQHNFKNMTTQFIILNGLIIKSTTSAAIHSNTGLITVSRYLGSQISGLLLDEMIQSLVRNLLKFLWNNKNSTILISVMVFVIFIHMDKSSLNSYGISLILSGTDFEMDSIWKYANLKSCIDSNCGRSLTLQIFNIWRLTYSIILNSWTYSLISAGVFRTAFKTILEN